MNVLPGSSQFLVDIQGKKTTPLDDGLLGPKDAFLVSPSGDRMVVAEGNAYSLVETATGRRTKQVSTPGERWVETQTMSMDWEANQLLVVWRIRPQKGESAFARAVVDFGEGLATTTEAVDPWPADARDRDTRLGRFLLAYGRAQAGETGWFPILTERLKRGLDLMSDATLAALSFEPDEAYLSCDGETLFVVKHETVRGEAGRASDTSRVAVLCLDGNAIEKEIDFANRAVCVLPH